MRAQGAYAEAESTPGPGSPRRGGAEKLMEYAVIEPDVRELRSSRRMGGLVTAIRRVLVWLLWPYWAARLADQSRFNTEFVRQLQGLEAALDQAEDQLGGAPLPGRAPSAEDR
jgi:hypothetical protein